MLIKVITLGGNKFTLELNPGDTIVELEKKIEDADEKLPISMQKILYQQKSLNRELTIGEQLSEGATIYVRFII